MECPPVSPLAGVTRAMDSPLRPTPGAVGGGIDWIEVGEGDEDEDEDDGNDKDNEVELVDEYGGGEENGGEDEGCEADDREAEEDISLKGIE
jgi:hypothetical protein